MEIQHKDRSNMSAKFVEFISDNVKALIWSGRPSLVLRVDRNKHYRDYFRVKNAGHNPEDMEGTVKIGLFPVILIFEPCYSPPDEVLRHECQHIRLAFEHDIPPAVSDEAIAAYWDCDPTAPLYSAAGSGMLSEAVVRLADRCRLGQPMPPLSSALRRLVRRVASPSPFRAAAHLVVIAMLVVCFVTASS